MYAIDIETHDPNLKIKGSGSIAKDGKIYCIGVYGEGAYGKVEDVFRPEDPQVRDILATTDTKVFHNGVYDLSWLIHGYDFKVNGRIEDTMTREVILDEQNDAYNLNASCFRRGVEGKNFDDTLVKWLTDRDVRVTSDKGKTIDKAWEMDPTTVARYCIQDCKATYNLWYKQEPLIKDNQLEHVNDIESRLYPILMEMKKNGVRVDVQARDDLAYKWTNQVADYRQALKEQYGLLNINSPKQITECMHRRGIQSAYATKTGNESWGHDALADIDHPIARLLNDAKTYDKALGTFIRGYFTDCLQNGRIHPTFYPSLRDEGGTITGRFSSRDPNMQNIPADDRTMGPQIRALIIPEEDHIMCAFDYKQIEYTVFIHYAIGPGAEQARRSIIEGVDYHSLAQKLLKWDTEERQKALGWSPHDARKMVKNFNFGSIYGLGRNSFKTKFRNGLRQGAKAAGIPYDTYCDRLYDEYFRLLTFVRPTCKGMQALCESKGFMRSIGGRIHHRPLPKGMCARDYAIVNYICQGGASDILKAGFVKAWDEGVFDYIKAHLTVHDENVFSVAPTKASIEAAEHYAKCMTEAVKLKVPIRVDKEAGFNWADCNEDQWEQWKRRIE